MSIIFTNKKSGEVESVCGIPPSTYPYINSKQCECTERFYWNGLDCDPCDSACDYCFGGTNEECFSCAPGYVFYLNKCLPACPGQYLLSDLSTCNSTCNYPYSPSVEGGINYCKFPCEDNEYLYWNNSCGSCPSPFKKSVLNEGNICQSPCNEGEYLNWNGTCRSACLYPLKARIEDNIGYCDFVCNDEFLYWNQTCDQFCVSPFSIVEDEGKKLCVCTGNYTIYEGTCIRAYPIPSLSLTSDPRQIYLIFSEPVTFNGRLEDLFSISIHPRTDINGLAITISQINGSVLLIQISNDESLLSKRLQVTINDNLKIQNRFGYSPLERDLSINLRDIILESSVEEYPGLSAVSATLLAATGPMLLSGADPTIIWG